jgi:hypothetical protein
MNRIPEQREVLFARVLFNGAEGFGLFDQN